MTSYNKSILTDFGGVTPNIRQLQNEISLSLPSINYINMEDDTIQLIFTSELSGAEIITMNSIISSHAPSNEKTLSAHINAQTRKESIKSSTWFETASFTFPGGTFAKIYSYSYMDDGATSYSVRVYDKTNNTVIVENSFTNTVENQVYLGIGSNVPISKAVWKVQVKLNGNSSKRVYIENVTVDYE